MLKYLSQRALTSTLALMFLSIIISGFAFSVLITNEAEKALFSRLQVEARQHKSWQHQQLCQFLQREYKHLRVESIHLYLSPNQRLKTQESCHLKQVEEASLLPYGHEYKPFPESFLKTQGQGLLITRIHHSTSFFNLNRSVYEFSFAVNEEGLTQQEQIRLIRKRARWIVRGSTASILDRLKRLSFEQGWILLGQAFILSLFALYLIYQHLIIPIKKLTYLATELGQEQGIVPPLEQSSHEFMLLQKALIDSYQALQDEKATLATTYQRLALHERQVTSAGLSANVLHEIGNPLASVMGLVEYLQEHESDREQQIELLSLAYSELQRMKQLSKSLLNLSKTHASFTDLPSLFSWARMILKYHQEYANITLECTGESELILKLPSEVIQIALINLMMNAARAQQGQGRIWIHTVLKPNSHLKQLPIAHALTDEPNSLSQACLYIWDQGCDVPHDLRASLFKAWQSQSEQGHGLGLAIARATLEQHQAQLHYLAPHEREHLDQSKWTAEEYQGACFCISAFAQI